MNKIPLARRLGQDSNITAFVELGFTQLRDVFLSLEEQNSNGCYSDVYYGIICEALEDMTLVSDEETAFDDVPTFPEGTKFTDKTPVAEAVAMVMNLPGEKRANLLYHIMIEPFT